MLFVEYFVKFLELKLGGLKFCSAGVLILYEFVTMFEEIGIFKSIIFDLGNLFKMGKVVTVILLDGFNIESQSLLSFGQVCMWDGGETIWDVSVLDSFFGDEISLEISLETNMIWSFHLPQCSNVYTEFLKKENLKKSLVMNHTG
jgi:hypothetical protein